MFTMSSLSCTFTILKNVGLGVIIGEGGSKPDGSHIIIEKILDGMDAATVSPRHAFVVSSPDEGGIRPNLKD